MTRGRRFSALALACGLAFATRAAAEEAQPAPVGTTETLSQCVETHEQAGMLRLEERWEDARVAMRACASERCPLAIRTDCARWLEQLTALLPTLIIVIERDDDGAHPVRLSLDGRELELTEPLRPIEVVPGTHQLEFTLPSYTPLEQEVTVRAGEKNKVVRVRFERESKRAAPRSAPVPPPAPVPANTTRSRPVPTVTYLLAGGAVLAAGTSGSLLAAALSRRSTARERCAPGCYDGQREEVDRLLLGADIAAAAGLAFAGFAVYTFVARPTVELPAAPRVGVAFTPAPGLSLSGRF